MDAAIGARQLGICILMLHSDDKDLQIDLLIVSISSKKYSRKAFRGQNKLHLKRPASDATVDRSDIMIESDL